MTTFVTSTNECWLGEGGRYTGECSSVYFFTCDMYTVEADNSCYVYTFSDSRVTYFSKEVILAHYWEYYRKDSTDENAVIDGDADMTGGDKCYARTDTPTQYEEGSVMNYTKGMCGFKY